MADSIVVDEGSWIHPTDAEIGPRAMSLLVLEGLITRTIRFGGLESPELVGAGDLLRPWEDAGGRSLEFATDWHVIERAAVAILDGRFAERIGRVAWVAAAPLGRTVDRTRGLAFQLAIAHVRRAEPRVIMLFWHLADRFGRVTPAGVVVPLRLTHVTIARLVGMRRPTVSATLTRLVRSGALARNADGTWTLTGAPPDLATIAAATRRELLEAA